MTQRYPGEIEAARPVSTADEIFDLVREDLQAVEEAIGVESGVLQNVPKRLHAALLLLCARIAGGGDRRMAIQLGAVVEMLRAATLAHHDLIGAERTRLDAPGTGGSVLAGDWLYMRAFRVALREGVLGLVIGAAQMMVQGELIERDRIGQIEVTEADCLELAHCRTAGLFSACGKLGAAAAGGDPLDGERLGEFAWNLGMALQLTADLRDFASREPAGGDLRNGRVTLPLVYALERASAPDRNLVARVLRDRGYDAVPFARVLALVEGHGGMQRAHARARQFADRARQVLADFPDHVCRRALFTLADLECVS